MNRAITFGLYLASFSAVICALLIMLFQLGPLLGIKVYPRFTVPAAALIPLLVPSIFVKWMLAHEMAPMSRNETLVFGAIAVFGCAVASVMTESTIIHNALSQAEELPFSKVLFAPFGERYSFQVLFGLSFSLSATLVMAYVAFLRIPLTLKARATQSQTKQITDTFE